MRAILALFGFLLIAAVFLAMMVFSMLAFTAQAILLGIEAAWRKVVS